MQKCYQTTAPLHCCSAMQSNVLHWLLVLGTAIHCYSLDFTRIHWNSLDFTGVQCKLDIQVHFCNVLLLCSFFQSKVGSASHCIETFFSLNTIHPLRETSILGADQCLAISSFWDWDLKLHFSNCPVFQAGHFRNLVACGNMWGVVTVVRTSYFYMRCFGMRCCDVWTTPVCDALQFCPFFSSRNFNPAVS